MAHQHVSLAAGRWQTLSFLEQMGNIGSEVGRAAKARGDEERFWPAIGRAYELLGLTIADPRWRTRLKELTRARELLGDAIGGGRDYGTTFQDLDKYFFHFALAARAGR